MAELLIGRAEQGLKELNLDKTKNYGLAFSGGPDSMFLAYLLKRCDFNSVTLLYVNYHDSAFVDQEENTVFNAAKALKYKVAKIDTRMEGNGNFEKRARDIRYKFFSTASSRLKLEGVFTAHQQDDLLITFLIQKMRGGIVEYWGIAPKRLINGVQILRPLLSISKSDIIGYLKYNRIPYYDDITNKNLNRTRNWIRENLLPSLDRKQTSEEISKFNSQIEINKEKLILLQDNKTLYSDYELLPEDLKLSLIVGMFGVIDIKSKTIDKIIPSRNLVYENLKNKNSTISLDLPIGLTLYRNYKDFYILKTVDQVPYSHTIYTPGNYDFKEIKLDITDLTRYAIKPSDFPLKIRSVRNDDTFSTNIINDSVFNFLKSQKVPSYLRNFYPVLVNKNDKVIYVPFYEDILEKKIPWEIKNFIL